MATPVRLSRITLQALNKSAHRLPATLSHSTYSILRSHHFHHATSQIRSTPVSPLYSSNFRLKLNLTSAAYPNHIRSFHSTPRNQGLPFLPVIASILKTSSALEIARTVGRIALTLAPLFLFKNAKLRKRLQKESEWSEANGITVNQEKTDATLNKIRQGTIVFRVLLAIPLGLFLATLLASLERTPLTGRWRMIILSPEEEDDIAAQLAGPGWYNAVGEILAEDGEYKLISPNDWRYAWVRDTLRKLESTIPLLLREKELEPEWLKRGPDDVPLPPPAEYPLKPRPKASEFLHRFCESMSKRLAPPRPHSIPGPPYSLLVVEKPDASNAFSYGFGPDGGGGVVVYSGFLDEVLAKTASKSIKPEEPPQKAWWSYVFGGAVAPPEARRHIPTPEETSQLAILLSHELSHLILSHHLETLSFGKVVYPAVLSIATDMVRALLFPITMLFGPFVNDAVAQIGKVGSGELLRMGEYCGAAKQEIEADIVSTRLLAYAGFDARDAPKFWENRVLCSNTEVEDPPPGSNDTLIRRIMGESHPINEVRVQKLKEELERWRAERAAALSREW